MYEWKVKWPRGRSIETLHFNTSETFFSAERSSTETLKKTLIAPLMIGKNMILRKHIRGCPQIRINCIVQRLWGRSLKINYDISAQTCLVFSKPLLPVANPAQTLKKLNIAAFIHPTQASSTSRSIYMAIENNCTIFLCSLDVWNIDDQCIAEVPV